MGTPIMVIDASGLSPEEWQRVWDANCKVYHEDHDEECPVRHGASADCVWPIAVCVPEDFKLHG